MGWQASSGEVFEGEGRGVAQAPAMSVRPSANVAVRITLET
jgi:hypothetical protein